MNRLAVPSDNALLLNTKADELLELFEVLIEIGRCLRNSSPNGEKATTKDPDAIDCHGNSHHCLHETDKSL